MRQVKTKKNKNEWGEVPAVTERSTRTHPVPSLHQGEYGYNSLPYAISSIEVDVLENISRFEPQDYLDIGGEPIKSLENQCSSSAAVRRARLKAPPTVVRRELKAPPAMKENDGRGRAKLSDLSKKRMSETFKRFTKYAKEEKHKKKIEKADNECKARSKAAVEAGQAKAKKRTGKDPDKFEARCGKCKNVKDVEINSNKTNSESQSCKKKCYSTDCKGKERMMYRKNVLMVALDNGVCVDIHKPTDSWKKQMKDYQLKDDDFTHSL